MQQLMTAYKEQGRAVDQKKLQENINKYVAFAKDKTGLGLDINILRARIQAAFPQNTAQI